MIVLIYNAVTVLIHLKVGLGHPSHVKHKSKKLVQCVSCGSSNITKELSSPNVSVKKLTSLQTKSTQRLSK